MSFIGELRRRDVIRMAGLYLVAVAEGRCGRGAGIRAQGRGPELADGGDVEQVFAWLHRAVSNHASGLEELLADPLFMPYRDDPRFAAVCARVGLPVPRPAGTASP